MLRFIFFFLFSLLSSLFSLLSSLFSVFKETELNRQMTPPTENGQHTETELTRQVTTLIFSKGAEGVIQMTTPLGKSPACDVVRLCFVVCVFVCICHVCRKEQTERVRAVYAPLIEICCAACKHTQDTTHHTTPHHTTQHNTTQHNTPHHLHHHTTSTCKVRQVSHVCCARCDGKGV